MTVFLLQAAAWIRQSMVVQINKKINNKITPKPGFCAVLL